VSQATVSGRGAARWRRGHPWIYRSDVRVEPTGGAPGVVGVDDERGALLGSGLYSPTSEIRLRMLSRGDIAVDAEWWRDAIAGAAARRAGIRATAHRLVHSEADGLPSLVIDRYGPFVSVQLLSAGLEAVRSAVLEAIEDVLAPTGIVLRNDVPVRDHESLPRVVETIGEIPELVEVDSDGVRMLVDLRGGQKTGAFLDQRENQWLAGEVAGGDALDLFCYEGGFSLRMASAADRVVSVDQSARALSRLAENAELNARGNIDAVQANAFDFLRSAETGGRSFRTIVLDPPAFARNRRALARAMAGYKDLNLRALRLLDPGGHLLTFSCSYHVSRQAFEDMLREAAADSGRRVVRVATLGAGRDHPDLLAVPESSYLKGTLLQAIE